MDEKVSAEQPAPPRLAIALALLALLGLAWAARTSNRAQVVTPDGVVLGEFDPYYHVWRVFQTLRDYPHVPVFDPAMNHPKGAVVIWPPLFDLGIATAARLAGYGPDDVAAVERLAAHVPPLLGALSVLPVFFLARRLLGDSRWALLATAVFAFTPIHVWYSRLGFVDHHVAVTLAQVLMLLAFLWGLRLFRAGAITAGVLRLVAVAAAVATLLLGLLVWNGFIFFVFVLDVGLLAALWVERVQAGSRLWMLGLASHLPAALLVIPFVRPIVERTGQPFSPLTLSWIEVVALLAFAAVCGLEGLRRAAALRALPAGARKAALLLPLAAGLAVTLFYSPRLAQGFQWLTASDTFMASVVESGSSLVTGGRLDFVHPYAWLTGFYLAMPVALILLLGDVRRAGGRDLGRLLLVVAGALLFAMSVLQRRFGEPFAPLQAVLAADLLRRLFKAVSEKVRTRPVAGPAPASRRERRAAKTRRETALPDEPGRAANATLAGALAVGLLVAAAFATGLDTYGEAALADGRYAAENRADLLRLARELDRREGPTAMGVARREGVLTHWDLGHRVLYVTHAPVVANNFGLHIGQDSWQDAARFFLVQDETEALALLEARRVRFVVTDWDLSMAQLLVGYVGGQAGDYFETVRDGQGTGTVMKPAFTRTLYFRLGSRHAGSQGVSEYPGGRQQPIEALHHFRLLFETAAREPVRALRIYERVAGARLAVSGAPAGGLRLSYEWRTPEGQAHRWRAAVEARDGRAEAVLPYSSELPSAGQQAVWRMEGPDGRATELHVGEADVQSGATITLDWGGVAALGSPR